MSIIRIRDIAHVRFAAPDLDEMGAFLEDFGLTVSRFNGRLYGSASDGRPFVHAVERGAPAFLAVGFRAQGIEDLELLAKSEGVQVEALDEPGGGYIVRLRDPDGFGVEVVAGQVSLPRNNAFADPLRNTAAARTRLGEPVRLSAGPSHVRRIGHCVLNVSDFRTSEAWYKQRFGFLTSDEVEAAPDLPLGAFMRCDRGNKPSDHHTLFLAQLPQKPGFLHAAFEVANLDDLMLGHQHLKARKRKAAWGVGRHIMGSQIFDYWKDPWGNELEHWTDGDLLTADHPPQKMPVSSLLAVQWGSPHPMTAGRLAPPSRLLAFVMTTNLRFKRLFRRTRIGQTA